MVKSDYYKSRSTEWIKGKMTEVVAHQIRCMICGKYTVWLVKAETFDPKKVFVVCNNKHCKKGFNLMIENNRLPEGIK